jgi:hypothetical protein
MGKQNRRAVVLEPDAAGIDIGAEEIYVAVPPDRDEESTRKFSTFTRDLTALAGWLEQCHVRTVAMESTGVYWIPLFQILEERGSPTRISTHAYCSLGSLSCSLGDDQLLREGRGRQGLSGRQDRIYAART